MVSLSASKSRRVLLPLALVLLSVTDCSVDERALRGRSASGAGSGEIAGFASSSAGSEDVGAGHDTGEAGQSENAGEGGVASHPVNAAGSGGTLTPSAGGGAVGAPQSGAGPLTSGSGGANSTSNPGGNAGLAGSATTGGAGSGSGAGAPPSFPCGDIDQETSDQCTANAVQNPRFDVDVEQWSADTNAQAKRDSRDGRRNPNSGSILIANIAQSSAPTSGWIMATADQCLQVIGDLRYQIAARVFIPGAQGSGEAGLNLWIFGNDGCTGTFLTAITPSTTQDTDSWVVVESQIKMPPAARSVVIRLAASKPLSQPALNALFDDVSLRQVK